MKSNLLVKEKKIPGYSNAYFLEAKDVMQDSKNVGKQKSCNNSGNNDARNKKRIKYIYKYMDMDTAIKCLVTNTLRFSQPTRWKDEWEQRFYNASYDNVNNGAGYKKQPLWACCFTTNKKSEASWNTYKYEKQGLGCRCVKLKMSRVALRNQILCHPEIKELYEGFMNYSLTDYEIENLHLNGRPYHNDVFAGDFNIESYLSLMLLKRQSFYYERELRFMFLRNVGYPSKREKIDIKVTNWAEIVKGVTVESSCTKVERCILQCCLLKAGIQCPIEMENLHKAPNNNIITIQ